MHTRIHGTAPILLPTISVEIWVNEAQATVTITINTEVVAATDAEARLCRTAVALVVRLSIGG